MRSIAGFIIRTSAFVSKELSEILRQTRLLLALVLGPFLILLLFGLGFRNDARVLRTLFVVPVNDKGAQAQVQQYATSLGPQLDYRGAVTNLDQALFELRRGAVDAVVSIPADAEAKIRNNEQPVVQVFHNEIDPFQVSYVEYVGQIYVDEVNRRVLQNIAAQGQQQAADVQGEVQTAHASAQAMREAFSRNDAKAAMTQRSQMDSSMGIIALSVGSTLGVLQGVEQTTGGGDQSQGPASAILGTMNSINSNNASLQNTPTDKQDYSSEAQRSAKIEQDLAQLDTQLRDFRQISPQVLVSPFRSEAIDVNKVKLTSSDFFAPGVIVLLLQHLLVTFAALSIVRERTSGTMELFRVAPVNAFETLLGKYISYMFIGILLAAGISALVVLILGVPMLGNWLNVAYVLLALMFAALGIGFVVSLISLTTSQAVQFSMLVLLFSIFFSGFFLDLRLMWPYMRFLAYSIPATYGMQMLQQIMFRARGIDYNLIGGLLGIGLLLFLISWFLLARQMRTR
jgi:ABC-2 type transport system permease protein